MVGWVKKSLKLTLNNLGQWSKFISGMCHVFVHHCLKTHLLLRTTNKGIETSEWKHKVCDYSFWQQKNIGNITWNTGVLTTKLNAVTHGTLKPFLGKEKYIRRAQYILSMRNSDK